MARQTQLSQLNTKLFTASSFIMVGKLFFVRSELLRTHNPCFRELAILNTSGPSHDCAYSLLFLKTVFTDGFILSIRHGFCARNRLRKCELSSSNFFVSTFTENAEFISKRFGTKTYSNSNLETPIPLSFVVWTTTVHSESSKENGWAVWYSHAMQIALASRALFSS